MSVAIWIAAGALGGLGAVGRGLVDLALRRLAGPEFPWGITVANVTGALAAGALVGATDSLEAEFVIAGGFLSSYTTFSTWMLDVMVLWRSGRRGRAALNLGGSLAAGLLAATAGWGAAQLVA